MATIAEFPYDATRCDAAPDENILANAAQFRIAGARGVDPRDDGQLKLLLSEKVPILLGLRVHPDTLKALPAGAIYQTPVGTRLEGHALVIVGYDKDKGYKVLNSWGATWSDGGFGWVSAATIHNESLSAYVMDPLVLSASVSGRRTSEAPVLTIRTFKLRPTGARVSEPIETKDLQCEEPCVAQPPHLKYSVSVAASPGMILRDPRLICIEGPCHIANSLVRLSTSADQSSASADWEAWSRRTVWELVADEFEPTPHSESVQRLVVGREFEIRALGPSDIGYMTIRHSLTQTVAQIGSPQIRAGSLELFLKATRDDKYGRSLIYEVRDAK